LEKLGFERCIDYPALPGHVYYEGYFHTLSTANPVHSVHPRHGFDFDKRAAPLRLRAFAESFRRKNTKVLKCIEAAMPRGSVLRKVFQEGKAFGDAAMQIHYGDAVGPDHVGWHVDAANSALHMALSLRGCRTLKMKVGATANDATVVTDKPQSPGDVYVGNPVSYAHGLEYPAVNWDQRVVACQLRLLMTQSEMFDPFVSAGMNEIAHQVSRMRLSIPSLVEVEQALADLAT